MESKGGGKKAEAKIVVHICSFSGFELLLVFFFLISLVTKAEGKTGVHIFAPGCGLLGLTKSQEDGGQR